MGGFENDFLTFKASEPPLDIHLPHTDDPLGQRGYTTSSGTSGGMKDVERYFSDFRADRQVFFPQPRLSQRQHINIIVQG